MVDEAGRAREAESLLAVLGEELRGRVVDALFECERGAGGFERARAAVLDGGEDRACREGTRVLAWVQEIRSELGGSLSLSL